LKGRKLMQFRPTGWFRPLLALCALLLFSCAGMQAQLTTADFGGAVTDSTGAVIPHAQITLVEIGTHTVRKAQSNDDGAYAFNQIQPGIYSLKIEARGFKAFAVSGVQVSAGAHPRVDAKLDIGQTAETVEVTAESISSLQSDSSSLESSVPEQSVQDLPLNGRNFINLVQIQPGVNAGNPNSISSGGKPDDRRQSASISANGQSDFLNNNMVDGLDNNEREQGLIGFRPSIDAISEVHVLTNDYPAEVGRSSGAVVNVITQAGSNSFHGSLFDYLRNDMFDSRDFFATKGQVIKPELRLNQFGGSVGGPVRKDKTFFFFAMEKFKQVKGESYISTVPTLAEEQNPGDFSDIGGPTLTAAQVKNISPVSLNYFKMYPAPDYGATGASLNNFYYGPKQTQDSTTMDARVDHHINANNTLFTHYSYNPVTTFVPGKLPGVKAFGKTVYSNGAAGFSDVFAHLSGPSNTTAQGIALDYLHIFTPNMVGELKAGFTRVNIATYPLNYGSNISAQIGVQNAYLGSADTASVPTILFWGGPYATLGDGFWTPILDVNNTYQYRGTLSWSHGNHNIKGGAALIRRQLNYFQDAWSAQGGFAFFGGGPAYMEQFLDPTDYAPAFSAGYRGNLLVKPGYRSWEPSLFVQDDWRFTPTLTLNLGVRYEIFTPFTEAHNQYANFNPATATVVEAGKGISSTLGVNTDYSGIAPRFGFAQVLPGKAVLRGGFGLTFFPVDYQAAVQNPNPPTIYTCQLCAAFTYPVLPTPSVSLSNPSGSLSYKPSSYRSGYSEQFNLTVEKDFKGVVARAGYVGELGRHLLWATDINRPLPPGAGNPTPAWKYASQLPNVSNINWWMNNATSSYHALQLSASTNSYRGLTFSANYTWSHGITDGTPEGTSNDGAGLISNDVNYDKGNSQLNTPNRVAVVADYVLPFAKSAQGVTALLAKGWQVNMLSYWQSGTYFSVLNGNELMNIPGVSNNERPSVVPGAKFKLSNPSITQWFNTQAFIGQTFGTPGNEVRNQIEGPHDRRADLSLFKNFPVYREATLQFRAECYNISNSPNFGLPQATGTFDSPTQTDNGLNTTAGFGAITNTNVAEMPRQWQFALKLKF
jgi:hypothetical protein